MAKVKQTDYLYLSAHLRARENALLNRERLERMLAAPDFAEASKLLSECGYPEPGDASDAALEAALSDKRRQTLRELDALCPEKTLVEAFRLRYDYHNAKVLVKSRGGAEGLLSDCGRVEPEALTEAYRTDQWRDIPPALAAAIRAAAGTLARTSSPQLADMGLDRAYFSELLVLAGTLSDDFLSGYARLCVDVANLKSAVRCLRGRMDEGVLRAALIEGGNIPAGRIAARAYSEGVEASFQSRELAEAAALGARAAGGEPLSAFERACDNALMIHLRSARLVSFGPAVAAAYLAAVEAEIVAARTVLLGKRAGVDASALRDRLRLTFS